MVFFGLQTTKAPGQREPTGAFSGPPVTNNQHLYAIMKRPGFQTRFGVKRYPVLLVRPCSTLSARLTADNALVVVAGGPTARPKGRRHAASCLKMSEEPYLFVAETLSE